MDGFKMEGYDEDRVYEAEVAWDSLIDMCKGTVLNFVMSS